MVSCTKFKSEVFACLLVSIIGLTLSMTSVITKEWVSGTVTPTDPLENGEISVNYGLFAGNKQKERGSIHNEELKVVCTSGVCMLSCGDKSDLEDILCGSEASGDTSSGDLAFCSSDSSVTCSSSTRTTTEDIEGWMLRQGMYISVLFFFFAALFFSIVNIVLTTINIAHNPISAIFGVDGLVVWNVSAAFCFLLAIILFGAEYNEKLAKNVCISETLRIKGLQWSNNDIDLGYSFWLMLPNMFLHLGNAGVLGFRQYRRYYAPKSKQTKNLEMRVKETADGKDMLY